MNNQCRYIAETDENGAVIWLWEMQAGGRGAHPVRDLSRLQQQLKTATIDGATLSSATDWLQRAKHNAPTDAQRH